MVVASAAATAAMAATAATAATSYLLPRPRGPLPPPPLIIDVVNNRVRRCDRVTAADVVAAFSFSFKAAVRTDLDVDFDVDFVCL